MLTCLHSFGYMCSGLFMTLCGLEDKDFACVQLGRGKKKMKDPSFQFAAIRHCFLILVKLYVILSPKIKIQISLLVQPDREDELLRIEGGGGRVINWNGARVFGVLAMSRAIGTLISLLYVQSWAKNFCQIFSC